MAELPKDMIFHYHSDDGITIKVDAIPLVRCGECKYSSKPDTNGEIWCKREDHGEDLMECHGVGWFCADGEREVQE